MHPLMPSPAVKPSIAVIFPIRVGLKRRATFAPNPTILSYIFSILNDTRSHFLKPQYFLSAF